MDAARQLKCFGETDESVFKKMVAALQAGLKPIVCTGESLDEREAGAAEDVLQAQFLGGIAPLEADQFAEVTIAYEPVWAIGTGRTATPEIAADAHRFPRRQVGARFGYDATAAVRILYGGSVKPDNVKSPMEQQEMPAFAGEGKCERWMRERARHSAGTLSDVHAAVYVQHLAGDVAGFIAGEELHGGADILGLAKALERYVGQHVGFQIFRKDRGMSVSMNPGATAFTVMFRLAISWANVFVIPISPALDAT